MSKHLLIPFLLIFGTFLYGQELNIDVKVTTPALKTADPKTLQTLEREIRNFFNNSKFTNHEYEPEERIEGSIQFNIKDDVSANSFIADIYISTGRPVFGSNYTSPILNHVDKDVAFTYEELQPLRNNSAAFTDNLSSILTYYVYVILGFDYDTFSELGGEPYFRAANDIISSIPPNVSGIDQSWTAIGGERNRYWLIENLLNPRVKTFRQAMYSYHRNSLDKMHKDLTTSKAIMLSALKEVARVNETYPNSMIVQMFSNSKRAEILEIFKNSVKSEQREVFRIMATLDPAQSDFLAELR